MLYYVRHRLSHNTLIYLYTKVAIMYRSVSCELCSFQHMMKEFYANTNADEIILEIVPENNPRNILDSPRERS